MSSWDKPPGIQGVAAIMKSFAPPKMDFPIPRSRFQDNLEATEIAMRSVVREQGRNLVVIITERVKTLEANLKDDEALVVFCDAGRDRIRVKEFEFPNWHLAVVSGIDDDGNQTQRIAHVQNIELTCKVCKRQPNVKVTTIGFILPEVAKVTSPEK